MTFKELLKRASETCREEIKLLRDKGRDYTDGNDALENFKEAAKALGSDPWLIWAVYFRKHIRSIFSFIRNKKVYSEPIRGRFQDARNYLLLGLMLLEEEKSASSLDKPLQFYYGGLLNDHLKDHTRWMRFQHAEVKTLNNKRTSHKKPRHRKGKGVVGQKKNAARSSRANSLGDIRSD